MRRNLLIDCGTLLFLHSVALLFVHCVANLDKKRLDVVLHQYWKFKLKKCLLPAHSLCPGQCDTAALAQCCTVAHSQCCTPEQKQFSTFRKLLTLNLSPVRWPLSTAARTSPYTGFRISPRWLYCTVAHSALNIAVLGLLNIVPLARCYIVAQTPCYIPKSRDC